jgi:uncharacterized protein with GYD domain
MAHYMIQGSYSGETWAALAKNPEDRSAAARALAENLGGRIEAFYFCFGDDDFVTIGEFPDNVTAAAVAIAVSASKAFRHARTTPLITSQEMMTAAKKAGSVGYKAPGR